MIKRFLFVVAAALALCAGEARAAEQPTFEVGYSSYMVTGFRCSTNTVSAQINGTRPAGFTANIAGYRIINQDGTNSVWIGGPSVSTAAANGDSLTNLGEKLATGASGTWSIGKTYMSGGVPLIPLYCKGADAAGAAGIVISVAWFGY